MREASRHCRIVALALATSAAALPACRLDTGANEQDLVAARPDKAVAELCMRLAYALAGLTQAATLDGQQKVQVHLIQTLGESVLLNLISTTAVCIHLARTEGGLRFGVVQQSYTQPCIALQAAADSVRAAAAPKAPPEHLDAALASLDAALYPGSTAAAPPGSVPQRLLLLERLVAHLQACRLLRAAEHRPGPEPVWGCL